MVDIYDIAMIIGDILESFFYRTLPLHKDRGSH